MLDKLWSWVSVAEATMAESEACPIGDKLEVVEKQLADHEVGVIGALHVYHTCQ